MARISSGQGKLNVILDIDETFVHFLNYDSKGEIPKENSYNFHNVSSGTFVLRPKLREFLTFLFENCRTVSLWTWSEEEYAESIADFIEKYIGKRPHYVLHSDHAELSGEMHGNSKDLNMLWYGASEFEPLEGFHECNTILIDDLPSNSVNSSNMKNSITIAPFALFGEVKNRSDPYLRLVDDSCLDQVMDILRKIMDKFDKGCDGASNGTWKNVFSAENIARYGLGEYVKDVRLDKFKKINGKKTRVDSKMVEGVIAVSNRDIHHGGKYKRKTRVRESKRKFRSARTRKNCNRK